MVPKMLILSQGSIYGWPLPSFIVAKLAKRMEGKALEDRIPSPVMLHSDGNLVIHQLPPWLPPPTVFVIR